LISKHGGSAPQEAFEIREKVKDLFVHLSDSCHSNNIF
jgi:hypothetical protein